MPASWLAYAVFCLRKAWGIVPRPGRVVPCISIIMKGEKIPAFLGQLLSSERQPAGCGINKGSRLAGTQSLSSVGPEMKKRHRGWQEFEEEFQFVSCLLAEQKT